MPPRSNDPPGAANEPPLCVDLDGTLLCHDSFRATLWIFLRRFPWRAPLILLWWRHGRACVKRNIATAISYDVSRWQVHAAFLEFLRAERARGRRLILASGTEESVARRVAEHIGLFDEVIASDGVTNVTGPRKTARLNARFGEKGWDYAGNSRVDLPV
ncbi:MAG TPA: haloacid dehalogenase-like hydrolase, partial [Verrucomicrobiae bacterium]|nr:haloacid dehalogenase-like hydrolase [Verrucomicrobiae bacterium]